MQNFFRGYRVFPYLLAATAKWGIGWTCFRPTTVAETAVFVGIMGVIFATIAVWQHSGGRFIGWQAGCALPRPVTPLPDEC